MDTGVKFIISGIISFAAGFVIGEIILSAIS